MALQPAVKPRRIGSRRRAYDPSGNVVTFNEWDEEDFEYGGAQSLKGLPKILDNVRILRDFKNDDEMAFRVLARALQRHRETASPADLGV